MNDVDNPIDVLYKLIYYVACICTGLYDYYHMSKQINTMYCNIENKTFIPPQIKPLQQLPNACKTRHP